MIKLVWDDSFVRSFKKWKKKHPDLSVRFQSKLNQFVTEPFHPSLKTHSLSGKLQGCWALSLTYEFRLVFKFMTDEEVLLVDIGTHEDVY